MSQPQLNNILIKQFQVQFGLTGNNLTVADTDTYTGVWAWMEVISATAVINAITIDGAADAGLAAEFPVGARIFGKITSIDLTSGVVRMYGGDNNF